MSKRKNHSLLIAVIVFIFSFSIYLYPDVPQRCKDCGSIENCLYGSGLSEGYYDCYIVSTQFGISCYVYNWCGS
ncbi:MAG: hypothetical protein AB1432_08050 [Bacteroidota bacterium]